MPFIAAMLRTMIYVTECKPPISLFGRITTGRWIIPGYDRGFLTPLVALSLAVVCCVVAIGIGVDSVIAAAVYVPLSIYICIVGGPSFYEWRLTSEANVRKQFATNGHVEV